MSDNSIPVDYKACIMVVDDDAMVRDIIYDFLVTFGFSNILIIKDAQAAIKILRDQEKHVDLIISDWEMPGMSGLELLKAVRNSPHRKDTRFIMVTSERSQERMKITRAAQAQVDAYIIKPFRGHVLKEKIEEVLGHEKKHSVA